MDTPGKLVRKVRERHSLTQAQLAKFMARTSNYISMVERGDYIPSPSFMAHLELLDRILTVDPEYRTRGIIKESPDDPPSLHHLSGISSYTIA